ncbi:MAG: hypothetical protein R2806_23280 [Saprospiraceae bacterium]
MKNPRLLITLTASILILAYKLTGNYPGTPANNELVNNYFNLFSVEEHVLGHITGGTSLVATTHLFTNPKNPEEAIPVEEVQYSLGDPNSSFTAYYCPNYLDINNHQNVRMILDHFYVEDETPDHYSVQLEAHVIALPNDWIANQYINQQKETSYTSNFSVENGTTVANVHNIKVMDGVERFKSSTYLYIPGPVDLNAQKGPTSYALTLEQPIYYRIPDPISGSEDMRFILVKNVVVLDNGTERTVDYILNPIKKDKY